MNISMALSDGTKTSMDQGSGYEAFHLFRRGTGQDNQHLKHGDVSD